jgi:hypothetical protein
MSRDSEQTSVSTDMLRFSYGYVLVYLLTNLQSLMELGFGKIMLRPTVDYTFTSRGIFA